MNLVYPGGLPIAMSLVGYNALFTGLFVLFKRKDKAGFHYLIFNIFVSLWGIGLSFMLNNDLPNMTACKWGYISQISALFIPVTWFHFVLVYTSYLAKLKNLLKLVYLATFIIIPSTVTDWYVAGFRPMVHILRYPTPGPFFLAFTILFLIVVSYSFFVFHDAWVKSTNLERRRDYKLVFFATLYGFITGSMAFLPIYRIPFSQYNLLLMPLWQFLLAFGMTRYQIFNLEEMIQAAHKDKLAAIGTLAASINHEIRNPLYVIQGLAESHLANMKEGIYSQPDQALTKANKILKTASEHATRAVEIMRRFTEFSKPDGNKNVKEMVMLGRVFRDVIGLVSNEFELKKIKLNLSPMSGLRVFANRRHLEEILFNLIVNACQAMGDNGGDLSIKAYNIDRVIRIEISDSGPGISKENRAKIFDPFYSTKGESGTGLGLYITKKLVENNDGKIFVESFSDKGTSFIIKLPIWEEESNTEIGRCSNSVSYVYHECSLL